MKYLLLFIALLTLTVSAQQRHAVEVDQSANLLAPTNFFNQNSAIISNALNGYFVTATNGLETLTLSGRFQTIWDNGNPAFLLTRNNTLGSQAIQLGVRDGNLIFNYGKNSSSFVDFLYLSRDGNGAFGNDSGGGTIYDQSNNVVILTTELPSGLDIAEILGVIQQLGGQSNYFSGDISSPHFWGDGSHLTGVSAGSGLPGTNTVIAYGDQFRTNAISISNGGVVMSNAAGSVLEIGGTLTASSGITNKGLTSADAVATDANGKEILATAILPSHLAQGGATVNQALIWNGTAWTPLNIILWTNFDHNIFQTNANGFITISNIPGSLISGIITATIYLATNTVSVVDSSTPGLGLAQWSLDVNRLTIGDGSTAGGVPVGYRYVPSLTNYQTLMRTGELAITYGQIFGNASVNYGPTLWMNAGKTNPVPLFAVISGQGTNTYPGVQGPVVVVNLGSFGINGTLAQGAPGSFNSAFLATVGNGGNSVSGGVGGKGGTLQGTTLQSGNGGNATNATSFGGNGGNTGQDVNRGGVGGNDFQGAGGAGGNGGTGGNIFRYGGRGADDGATVNGGNGGNSGNIDLHGVDAPGADASGGANGGNGGSITAVGVGSNNAGSLVMSATANSAGGNLTAVASTYIPATLFTTTTTAGPSASSAETSLLGTAAFLAPPTGQAAGKLIPSNVVSHVGRTLAFQMAGTITSSLTPTLEIRTKIGSTNALDTGPQTIVAVTGTDSWTYNGQITFRTTGSAAQFIGTGVLTYFSSATGANFISTTNAVIGTVDMTKDETIDVTAQFNANNTLQCTTARFDLVN